MLQRVKEYKNLTIERLNDIYASSLIGDLLHSGDYIPITSSSLSPYSLLAVVNDIVVNNRKCIVEFGGGISSILIPRLFKRNNIKGKLYTVEENKNWLELLENILKKENLLDYVELIHAPLTASSLSLHNIEWYSENALDTHLGNVAPVNMVIVDGPSAWKKEISLARYPALPYMINKMDNNYSFYLDDVNRDGEAEILKLWEKNHQIVFSYISRSFAIATKGQYYTHI